MGTLIHTAEHQSAHMSKITNDSLTRSGTGCFIAVPYSNSGWVMVMMVIIHKVILTCLGGHFFPVTAYFPSSMDFTSTSYINAK